MPNIYIISGCNGAGKTTASYIVLPEILDCKEFVNADNIAAGISPFNPARVALSAGRIMLERISELMKEGADFAFETTLSTKSYRLLVRRAQRMGYTVTLLYFWLDSPDLAIQRVRKRVAMGGHHIPDEVVVRRYHRGLTNLLNIYLPICDRWLVLDNMDLVPKIVAQKDEFGEVIVNNEVWSSINVVMAKDKLDIYNTIPLTERIRLGVQKALRKLAEESALKGESLVVKVEGEIREVPAKDLLVTLPKSP